MLTSRRMWYTGSSEYHNGVMFVLLKDQRRLETVSGLGLEEVPVLDNVK